MPSAAFFKAWFVCRHCHGNLGSWQFFSIFFPTVTPSILFCALSQTYPQPQCSHKYLWPCSSSTQCAQCPQPAWMAEHKRGLLTNETKACRHHGNRCFLFPLAHLLPLSLSSLMKTVFAAERTFLFIPTSLSGFLKASPLNLSSFQLISSVCVYILMCVGGNMTLAWSILIPTGHGFTKTCVLCVIQI